MANLWQFIKRKLFTKRRVGDNEEESTTNMEAMPRSDAALPRGPNCRTSGYPMTVVKKAKKNEKKKISETMKSKVYQEKKEIKGKDKKIKKEKAEEEEAPTEFELVNDMRPGEVNSKSVNVGWMLASIIELDAQPVESDLRTAQESVVETVLDSKITAMESTEKTEEGNK